MLPKPLKLQFEGEIVFTRAQRWCRFFWRCLPHVQILYGCFADHVLIGSRASLPAMLLPVVGGGLGLGVCLSNLSFMLENGFYIVHFLLGLRVVSIFFLFIGDYWLILSNGKHWWTSLVDAFLCDFCTEHKQPAILFCDIEAHFTLFLISCFTSRL